MMVSIKITLDDAVVCRSLQTAEAFFSHILDVIQIQIP